ncbi:MAG: carboxymuconolactone decarboxylase family protein [Candidatus Helarchaeota archaeon]|nr:carboxymuconolactone decarboxylase family protein [Candidatus Helarchaeota archaeon]
MKGKIKELIAIGASIGSNCTSCLKHHVRLAKEFGATEEEINAAIEVALKVKKNSTRSIDKLIEDTIGENSQQDENLCC